VADFWSPTVWEAAHHADYAAVLRLARVRLGWTQGELGKRFGCSGSTISRFETSGRKLADVAVLRRFADVLGLPPEAFGLIPERARPASPGPAEARPRVGRDGIREEADDSVRRRSFLLAAGMAGTSLSMGAGQAGVDVDPAAFLTRRLQDVLFANPAPAATISPAALHSALVAASTDFHNCHYVPLATRLPALITAAQGHDVILAQAYNLTTRTLIKLDTSGLEWISTDRALRAADRAGDALTLVEAQRLMGSVCRRAGDHDRALALIMQATAQLDLRGRQPSVAHLARYGLLMCSAGYARARAGDRDGALELLGEATSTVGRLDRLPAQQHALRSNVLSHRVSSEYVLGNAGIALSQARQATVGSFPDTERRARFLVDVALSYAQFDKPEYAYRTLLAAERTAPGEVRTRATVRRLVGDLLSHRNQAALPGLREFANRTHVVA
jgi:transcriptional regulator with XRE-family HTH domain